MMLFTASIIAGRGAPGEGGVQFATTLSSDMTVLVGEQVCFTLTARDENGNVIRSWDQIGSPTTITLMNSTANTDTSTMSWSADPDDYSWAIVTHNGVELTKISDNEWSIPETYFVLGEATVCLINTKAEVDVYLDISPKFANLNQVTDKITFVADEITNYLVDLTSAVANEDAVYLLRPYEIIVAPRDRYLNISDQQIVTKFSARWPGEFDPHQPGLADIFAGEVFIQGLTNYLLASRIEREKPTEPQLVVAYNPTNTNIRGQTDPYEVLSHAPNPFSLLLPENHAVLDLTLSSALVDFTWERPNPPDPYWDIQVSRFNQVFVSDAIEYTWVIVDSISLTRAQRILSNNNGLEPKIMLSHGQLWSIIRTMFGSPAVIHGSCLWYVTATDGLYTTSSDPTPGHYISILADLISNVQSSPVPTEVSLAQNYPNPFNPSTSITFTTTRRGPVRLSVFDLLGKEVTKIVSNVLDAGTHTVNYSPSTVRSGVYIYRLEAEGKVLSRRMVVTK